MDNISQPLPVAETFVFEDEQGISLSHHARLDTMVTVVDSYNFFEYFDSMQDLSDRFQGVEQEDDRTVVDLLVDQIEFADVILLNKKDMVDEQQFEKVRSIVQRLNPGARVFPTIQSQIDLKEVLHTNLFNFEKVRCEISRKLEKCRILIGSFLLSFKNKHVLSPSSIRRSRTLDGFVSCESENMSQKP